MGWRENQIKTNRFQNMDPTERLFKINAGMGWCGKIVKKTDNTITIKNPRPLHAAPEGWPDLTGWTSVLITPEMVGTTVAVFTAEEIKAKGDTLRPMQKVFKKLLIRMGAIYRVLTE